MLERSAAAGAVPAGSVVVAGDVGPAWDAACSSLAGPALERGGHAYAAWLDEVWSAVGGQTDTIPGRPVQLDDEPAAQLASLLAETAPRWLTDRRNVWLLDFLAARLPEARFVLLFVRPQVALAAALATGRDPGASLDGWRTANAQLVRFWRRHRNRACLLDAEGVAANPESLGDVVGRFGISVAGRQLAAADRQGFGPPLPERLLAARLVESDAAARSLHGELQAGALPLGLPPGRSPPDADPIALFEEFSAWRQQQDDARRQLTDALAAADEARRSEVRLREQVQRLLGELDSERAAREAAERTLSAAAEDREILSGQLNCLQEIIDGNRQRVGALEAERRQLQTELAQAQQAAEVQAAARRDVDEDNQLMALQLNQLQQEVEHYVREYQRANAASASRSAELDEARRELASLREALSRKPTTSWQRLLGAYDRVTGRRRRAIARQAKALDDSGLFDRDWYRARYEDVRAAGIDPVHHYLLHGAAEGRDPSPAFNTRLYLARNPDVVASGMNPLLHFVLFGRKEGRQATP